MHFLLLVQATYKLHHTQNHHVVVPLADFTLLQGEEVLTTYRFNTMVAQHRFCSICGVQACECAMTAQLRTTHTHHTNTHLDTVYHPRSNPDGVAITAACITSPTVVSREERYFDGVNWEGFIESSGITSLSKGEQAEDGR